jgi:multidrug efflux pump subunit AcrB
MPIWIFSLAGDKTPLELGNIAKDIQEELERIPNVSSVTISGADEVEYHISYDPGKLELYNLTPEQVNQAVQSTNITMPIGEYQVGSYNHAIKVDNRFYSVQSLSNIAVANIGDPGVIFLRDVATVEEATKKRETRSRLSIGGVEPVPAVTLSVIKKSGGSIIDVVDSGQEKLIELQTSGVIPNDVTVSTTTDFSEEIRGDLRDLTRDFAITLVLVC